MKPKKSWAESQISEMKVKTRSEPKPEKWQLDVIDEAENWNKGAVLAAASAFGKLGGSVKSKLKARAARKNGAKGGRPRKEQTKSSA